MKKLIVLFLAFVLIFCGCAAQINKTMASWQGSHFHNLIAGWGPPDQVFSDGQEGRILIYIKHKQWTTPGKSKTYSQGWITGWDDFVWGTGTEKTVYTPPQTYQWKTYRMFWIDKDGYIYRWAWRGL